MNENIDATTTNSNTPTNSNTEILTISYNWEPEATSTQMVNAVTNVKTGNTPPKTFKEAMGTTNREIWEIAINRELNAMVEHAVWDVVPKMKYDKPLPCAWKFSYKDDGTPKARLYLVGNREPLDSLQNMYAPVTDIMTVFWMCSLAVRDRTPIFQMDVTTAFLNAPLDMLKFMRIPDGLQQDKLMNMCKLNKAIYGLRISPRMWYLTMEKILKDFGLTQSTHEPCLFYKKEKGKYVILTIYVDDLLLTGTDNESIREIREKLKKTYTVKDLGLIKRFLGMQFIRNEDRGQINVVQTEYITDILRNMRLEDANTKPTPMARFGNFPTTKTEDYLPNETEFRSIIGKLQYIGTHTRPDIAHAVNYCARHQIKPERIHWKLVTRILRYLKGTRELGLQFAAKGSGIA